jgi:acyl-CoA thioester hydrolase
MSEGVSVALPDTAPTSTIECRVAFYETDAMGIVHHANYLHFLERARVCWLEEHNQPYTAYMEQGLHFAVTRVDFEYHRSARFDDRVQVTTWLDIVRGASLRMVYRVELDGELIGSGATEHAVVSDAGRVRRIPKDQRIDLEANCASRKEI